MSIGRKKDTGMSALKDIVRIGSPEYYRLADEILASMKGSKQPAKEKKG